MSLLSNGPFSYNRFAKLDEQKLREKMYYMEKAGSKPDYLDFDGDGDKKEPMKKALKEKGKKNVQEKKELPDFIKNKMDEKKNKDKDCTCKEWVEEMVEGGYDLSEYNYSDLEEVFNEGMHRDAKTGKETNKAVIGRTYYPGSDVPKRKTSVAIRKEKEAKKEEVDRSDVVDYLMESGYTNNPVSAEVLIDNMSDAWLTQIIDEIDEAYQKMSAKATEMSKRRSADLSDKEYAAAGTGDEKKTNKIMHQKRKVMDARQRHGSKNVSEDLAGRTKNIIDADRGGYNSVGHQLQSLTGQASHAVNKAKQSARYMKGKV